MLRSDNKLLIPVVIWLILALAGLTLLDYVNELTRGRIADNRREEMLAVLRQIVPGQNDNDIFNDQIIVTDPAYLGSSRPVSVFRARNGENALGVVYYPVIAEGYNGPVELGIGISRDGSITGVRVMHEEETEGLGAQVHQQNSDWILLFSGQSFRMTPREQWNVSSENGYFDQISGATITSRSVINAVKNTLEYHEQA